MIILNVSDRRYGWIGAWDAEPLNYDALTSAHIGRTVIYRDHGRAEAGTITSWRDGKVWARFHRGVTAAACEAGALWLATRALDGEEGR